MLKNLRSLILIGVLLLLGVTGVLAQEGGTFTVEVEDYGTVVGINDGRVNAFDQAAPVAVYYKCGCEQVLNNAFLPVWAEKGGMTYKDVVYGIEILAIDPRTGNGSLALWASVEDIAEMLAEGETAMSANGVTLNIGENGWFWLTTGPDAEGKTYTFEWDDFGRTLPVVVD